MSELSPNNDPAHLPESVKRAIERNRRIVSEGVSSRYAIIEFSDIQTGRRIISMPRQSEQTRLHELLSEKHIPIFPVVDTDDTSVFLSLPGDARSIHASLRFVARDILHYKEVFAQIGEVLGRCQAAGVGLPTARPEGSVLEGVVYSSSPTEPFGSAVYLTPPYILSHKTSKNDEMNLIQSELATSGYFSQPAIDHLLVSLNEGWNSVRS